MEDVRFPLYLKRFLWKTLRLKEIESYLFLFFLFSTSSTGFTTTTEENQTSCMTSSNVFHEYPSESLIYLTSFMNIQARA